MANKFYQNIERVVEEIKSLNIQGSRSVALHALRTLQDLARTRGFDKKWDEMAELFQTLRPTQVLTYNAIEYVKHKRNMKAFKELENFFQKSYHKIVEKGLEVLEGNEIIMTHCHSTEELNILKVAHRLGYEFIVYVTETRPKLQGLKSAKELAEAGLKVKYIVDNAAGYYMKDADIAFFGIDAIRKEGVWNKIGTYLISTAAKYEKKEVWFAGDILKVDKRDQPYQEMRDKREIIGRRNVLPPEVEILNPAFDVTPWDLVTGVITGVDIFTSWDELKDIDLFKVIETYPYK